VISVIMITGIGDHLRPEWPITFTGIRRYGRFLLADALHRAVRSEIASFAVIVDAKDEAARQFYLRESFLPLPDQPMKLFRPMEDVAKLFEG
jgi:hypothetical protein